METPKTWFGAAQRLWISSLAHWHGFRIPSSGWNVVSIWLRVADSNVRKHTQFHLVGGIPTPLKNVSSSVGMIIPHIWKVIKFMFQTTNQSFFTPPLHPIFNLMTLQTGSSHPARNQPNQPAWLPFSRNYTCLVCECRYRWNVGMIYLHGDFAICHIGFLICWCIGVSHFLFIYSRISFHIPILFQWYSTDLPKFYSSVKDNYQKLVVGLITSAVPIHHGFWDVFCWGWASNSLVASSSLESIPLI